VPGFEASQWSGIVAPKKYARPDHRQLNGEINAALADAKFRGRISDLGSAVLTGSPADFEKLIADEIEKWAR